MSRRNWLLLLVALPLLAGFARLRFDAEVFNLLPLELPAVQGLQLQQQNFSGAHELLVTVEAKDAAAASAAAQAIAVHLTARPDLVRSALWQPPWIEQPASAAENLAWLWLQQRPEAFAALASRLASNQLPAVLAAARESLATSLDPQELARRSYDPLGLSQLPNSAAGAVRFDDGSGFFASADGSFRIVFLEPPRERMNYRETARWLTELKEEVAVAIGSLAGHSELKLSYTGGPAFLAEIATGMESDLRSSVLSTLLVIAGLFWLAHRSWRPLAWLIVSLLVTLAITLALGGLVFGTLNVISVGFAAVLLGLTVDYALVSYQEFVASPGKSPAEVRREVALGIGSSAATTAGTFLLLGLSGLPGLTQLGTLTAMGLLVGAGVMLFLFLPLVIRGYRPRVGMREAPSARPLPPAIFPTVLVVIGIAAVLFWRGWPKVSDSDDPLRPRQSAATAAMDEMNLRMGRNQEPTWAIFVGTDPLNVARQLESAELTLSQAKARGEVRSFALPTGFWPRPDFSTANRATALALAARAEEWVTAATQAGFTADSMALTRELLAFWSRAGGDSSSPWPTNATARWLVAQFAARDATGRWLALGVIEPQGSRADVHSRLTDELPAGVLLTDWHLLGPALMGHVALRVTVLMGLIAAVLAGCLWLVFRRWQEVVLGFTALGLSFALLLAMMSLMGWSWNLLSLVALPLLLGSSVDSTIHVQLALRRHGPNLRALWGTTGKALLLCAGANIAGFGSLAWSSNAGLASLDLVCAVGVGCVFLVCVGLLPGLWCALGGKPASKVPSGSASSLYRGGVWRVGLWLGRILPRSFSHRVARLAAAVYVWMRPARLAVVMDNLRPVLGDVPAVRLAARRNFGEFACKLVDLWRYESGCLSGQEVHPSEGWKHFSAALNSGSGVLLVTPHLGNWELGSPLLSQHGVRLLVLTAPEPEAGLTEVRRAARARLGIDTLVVGNDPFAFIQVIQRLQSGGVVALLMDRPPPPTQVRVEFFGQSFSASNAAAELARASGCVVLPVFIVRDRDGYRAGALAPVAYERSALGDRASRIVFTGTILRAFEPVIRQYAEQWFHFVPIWPKADGP